MKEKLINIDLATERASAALKSEDFAVWWGGGRDKLLKKRKIEQLFFNDPEFHDDMHYTHMSHAEYYEHVLKMSVKFIRKLFKEQLFKAFDSNKPVDINDLYELKTYTSGAIGMALFPQSSPLRLHHGMFIPAILTNASDEQQREWMPKAWNFDGWIGSYAQTELEHGTYLRGLETTAMFDIRRQQFILNSPSLSAYKWWPGSLGNTANIAIVVAQLSINGKPRGLQHFLVPLRNENTHDPLPGVDIGEIGPKVGMNGGNNGFLGLENVRIPLKNMLMKHAQVLPSGKFVQSPNPSLLYGTMMFLRVGIVSDVSHGLLLACTIATRYSLIRRQSALAENEIEPKIMDHITQQAKILPLIAKGIVFKLTSERIWKMYQEYSNQLATGDLNNMPQMHALSCVLKAVCSDEAEKGVTILRKSCGGHGFLASSNFGQIYGSVTAACTYEGENTVLLLQTARFLKKMISLLESGKKLPDTVAYLKKVSKNASKINHESTGLQLMNSLIEILEDSTAVLVQQAYHNQQQHMQHLSQNMAGNKAGLRLTNAAVAHGHCYLASTALIEAKQLEASSLPFALIDVNLQILELYVVDVFLNQLSNILRFNTNVTGVEVAFLETRFEYLMAAIRPNVISVVDGFDYQDHTLNSVLGAWDGRAYERLMAEARKNPLNQVSVNSTFYTHLKPLLQCKL